LVQPDQARALLVADAGPLIALAKCGHLALLPALFETVHVPQAVVDEVLLGGNWPETPAMRAYLQSQPRVHPSLENALVQQLRVHIHEGETQAIALAEKLPATLLIDEQRGRRWAQEHGVRVVGTLGILLRAKRTAHLDHIKPSILHMREHGYALSDSLVVQVLQLAGED
jgi:predicted nucleic acid-binding protein